jgi:hypothetical protein
MPYCYLTAHMHVHVVHMHVQVLTSWCYYGKAQRRLKSAHFFLTSVHMDVHVHVYVCLPVAIGFLLANKEGKGGKGRDGVEIS